MISMPLSSGSFSSSSVRPARPPPNSVLKVSGSLVDRANASVKRCCVVSSIRLIASAVCAIESTRSLRSVGQERVARSSSSNCSIAIMFTGRADRSSPRSAAIASSALSAAAPPPRQTRRRREVLVAIRLPQPAIRNPDWRRRRPRLVRGDDAGVRRRTSLLFELLDLGDDFVERRADRVLAGVRQVREIRFGGRLATSSSETTARIASSAPRASLIDAPASRRRMRSSITASPVVITPAGGRRGRALRRRAAPRPRRSIRAVPRCARRLLSRSAPSVAERCSSSTAASSRRRTSDASAPARSTSPACAAPASAARRLRSSAASRASNRRRCADGQPLVGLPLLVVQPGDRRPRFFLPAIEAVALVSDW
jgi:hypothetical protein